MRILVTGSRDWEDVNTIAHALVDAVATRPTYGPAVEPITVVHGAARGADSIADDLARRVGWTVEAYPVTSADWARLGRSAGHQRNQYMVNLGADVCLAFILNASSGATGCAEKAEAAGIPTKRYLAGATS